MAKIKVTGILNTAASDVDHFVDVTDLEALKTYLQYECDDLGISELRDITVEKLED